MLIPNTTAVLTPGAGVNKYGEPSWGTPRTVRCAVVRLDTTSEKTSVRTDSSASRGNADEVTTMSKILIMPEGAPSIGDRLVIAGLTFRIMNRHLRYDVNARLDHYECDLEIWQA